MNWRRDGFMPPGSDEGNYQVPGPTPEQAREADHPETLEELRQKLRERDNIIKSAKMLLQEVPAHNSVWDKMRGNWMSWLKGLK